MGGAAAQDRGRGGGGPRVREGPLVSTETRALPADVLHRAPLSLDPVLSLLDRCAAGPRYRPSLPSSCRREQQVLAAVEFGWVTYDRNMVTLTGKGRRALEGQQRWTALRQRPARAQA